VFVDFQFDESTTEVYKSPGSVISITPSAVPESGYKAMCHVQATTTNVSCVMRLNGQTIPARLTLTDKDPVPTTPLKERVFVFHQQLSNFRPNSTHDGKMLECVASSPNYPNVVVRNDVVFDVERKLHRLRSSQSQTVYWPCS